MVKGEEAKGEDGGRGEEGGVWEEERRRMCDACHMLCKQTGLMLNWSKPACHTWG